MTQYSMFDIMNGLELPTHALAPPHNIIELENGHQYAVVIHLPALGMIEAGVEREQVLAPVPDPDQPPPLAMDPEAELARALENFQELDRIRFGGPSRDVSSKREIIHEPPEDYSPPEDESIQD